MLLKQSLQGLGYLRLFLQLHQRPQLFPDQIPVQPYALPDNHLLDIDPILWPRGDGFQNDLILRLTRPNRPVVGNGPIRRPFHHPLLERHRHERNIELHPVFAAKRHDPVLDGER